MQRNNCYIKTLGTVVRFALNAKILAGLLNIFREEKTVPDARKQIKPSLASL